MAEEAEIHAQTVSDLNAEARGDMIQHTTKAPGKKHRLAVSLIYLDLSLKTKGCTKKKNSSLLHSDPRN